MRSQFSPSGNESRVSLPSTAHPSASVEASSSILSVLDDDACRSILAAADEPMTAKELAKACELPLSSVYRKLDRLANTPLMEETTRPRVRGKHPEQYQRRISSIVIRFPSQDSFDVAVSVQPRIAELH